MKLKLILNILIIVFSLRLGYAQSNDTRIENIQNQLKILSVENSGLSEKLNSDIALNDVTLSNFLKGISTIHNLNINVDNALNDITISNNFSQIPISTILVFLCKEYNLTIDFTDSIFSIKPYVKPEEGPELYPLNISYDPDTKKIDIDAKDNTVDEVFRAIMDASAKNLMYAPGMENHKLSAYIKAVDFDSAMDKLALANNLAITITKDNFYVFNSIVKLDNETSNTFNNRLRPGLSFEVIDHKRQLLNVDFINASIADVITIIGDSLAIDRFTATPLYEAGTVDFRAKSISFDEMLVKIFEQQVEVEIKQVDSNQDIQVSSRSNLGQQPLPSDKKRFTFKYENGIYFFGTENQLSVRTVEIIKLRNRSVNMMPDPELDINSSVVEDNFIRGQSSLGGLNTNGFNSGGGIRPSDRSFRQQGDQGLEDEESKTILDIIPDYVKGNLDCKVDLEMNSIYVSGTSTEIEFFKNFIKNIDKAIPVIQIEVMIVETSNNNTIETGVEWGIGDNPETTRGAIFPNTDLTLGAKTINRVINGFNSSSAFNFGQVVPNFFATVKAMETNGNLKIKSTPKLTTLNGHRASFSNGQTSYYAVTNRNTQGANNPIVNEIRNFFPIDAKLGLDIKPFVTGNGEVLLDIQVVQSTFGNRIDEDAPPDISSRNFSSVVRMKNGDIAVLGGLEEDFKNNSGSGVPFLARIPLIKFLFSKRVREARKSKLTVFIKPTVFY